ncbi:hypothetical protein DUI87_08597 [Hirundo rustica rustica]|uniref:Uncharacterized protein n=1 Tax=Hirundo rustica rustica TaxID=333673 RepID=A0A3M0KLM6_HIRRU|nr:hypothetical protein DUI87_08597 [Hirundo rustica rustica]
MGSKVLLSHEAPLNPLWIPKKPKPKSRSRSHRPASRKTSPYADIWRESSPESLDLTPNPEQTYDDSNEGHSKQRSEAKAAPSKILPGPVQPILHVYVQSIEGILKAKKPMDEPLIEDILREMSSSLPPFPSTLLMHPRAETSKLPLAPKPKPSTSRKWHLDNLVTQTKQGAVPREGPRDIGCGIGCEERKKPELGISSNSCQQHSKAREPPHKICGQPDKKSQKFFCPVTNNSEKSSGKGPMTSQKSCGQETKDPYKNFGQGAKDFHKSSGQVAKDFHKMSGKVVKDSQESSRQVAKYPGKSSGQVPKQFRKSPGHVAKEFQKINGKKGNNFHKSLVQVSKDSEKSFVPEVKESQKSCSQVAKHFANSSGRVAKEFHNHSVQGAKDAHKASGPLAKDSQKICGQVAKTPQEAHRQTKQSCLKPPVLTKEAVPRNTAGIKRPGEPLVHNETKRVWNVEINPGPWQVTDQSCKDQLKDKKTMMPKATDNTDLKLALHEPSEKTQDKGSHQANARGFLDPKLLGEAQECDALIPSGHRPGDVHREKVPLPPEEKKLFLPAMKLDLKRKAMRSPEESPGKKKVAGGQGRKVNSL